ncbi:hypothetical protein [Caldimonas tepidiphila]|uniref:hypothetical protein n=1 Tax=Caldimonas tepidiphila TaxID=2315841 RepID=UPI001300295F|nr:hypothetical protein [Caldimonas tepidiphila]
MEYTTEHGPQGRFFNVQNPPAPGTRLLTNKGDRVVFNGIGFAGMLDCIRLRDSSRQLYFPLELSPAR